MNQLAIGMLILSSKGEDAARHWYESLSDDQRKQLSSELNSELSKIELTFAAIAQIILRAQADALAATKPILDAWSDLDR